jgi:hypothetical protein
MRDNFAKAWRSLSSDVVSSKEGSKKHQSGLISPAPWAKKSEKRQVEKLAKIGLLM